MSEWFLISVVLNKNNVFYAFISVYIVHRRRIRSVGRLIGTRNIRYSLVKWEQGSQAYCTPDISRLTNKAVI